MIIIIINVCVERTSYYSFVNSILQSIKFKKKSEAEKLWIYIFMHFFLYIPIPKLRTFS